ncbi:hypothetical protein ACN28S_27885 [Cystobacter fuscus]
MTILNVKMHVPAVPALLAGLATGAAIGAFQGTWVTRFKVPSFVVTLAGSLAGRARCSPCWAPPAA